MTNDLILALRRFRFTAHRRSQAWRLMADLLEAGLPLQDALETAAEVAREQGRGVVGEILLDVREGFADGEFEHRITRYVPDSEALLFRNATKAEPVRIFRAAMRLADQQGTTRHAFRSAMGEPVLILLLIGATFQMLGAQLFPMLADTTPMTQWPSVARVLGQFCVWFAANTWILLGCFVLFVIGLRAAMRHWTTWPRDILDRIPPFSYYKLHEGVGFMFAITELARMGVTLQSSLLDQMAREASPYLRSRIAAIAREIQNDENWGRALPATGHDFPSRDLNAVLGALSRRNNWVEKFAGFLDQWLADLDRTLKARMAILKVALLFFAAAVIGIIMLSVLSIFQSLTGI
ncbi:type II secretion system F family protein [uncultured Ruegeria sp.]|uniref:type II secretion system F family protein n=1 Tax=uncultured Ruegeria sp. TaxID=259304 RepID=UPI0026196173|nr:type II secretion system F family protein [uncultured Ruegeria sp.]